MTSIAALFLPLLFYLYIPLRGDSDVGVEYHGKGFADMILASNASVWLKFGPPGFIWERITQVYLPLLVEQFTVVGFLVGWVGIVTLALKRVPRGFPEKLPARQLLLLVGLAHLAETAFAIVFWVVDSEIFFIPSYLTFLIFVGIGLAVLCDEIQTRVVARNMQRAAIGLVLGVVALTIVFLGWTNYARNDQSGNDLADSRWQEIFAQPLEANAVMMGPWEDLTPFEYYQYVENARRDLTREKIIVYEDQLKLAPQGDVAARVRTLLQNGTAVYLTRHPDDTETLKDFSAFDVVPVASLWRVNLRRATRGLALQEFGAQEELLSMNYQAAPTAGEFALSVFNWSPDAPLGKMRLVWKLRDADGRVWTEQETLPFGGREIVPTENSLRDVQGIFVPPDAPPGNYTLAIEAFERDSQDVLPLVGENNRVTQELEVNASEVAAPTEVLRIPRPLQADLKEAKFLGYGVDNVQPRGGDVIEFSTWWQGLTRGDANFEIKLRTPDGGEAVLYQGPLFSTQDEFLPQQSVRARQTITIPPQTPAGFARLSLALNGEALPEIRLSLDASQRQFTAPPIPHPQQVSAGDAMQLLGYKLERATLRPGDTLPLTLIWKADKTPDASYKVFVHLLDANGVLRAQQDSIPVHGTLPTNRWFSGEYVADDYLLVLPKDLPAGDYRLAVGMYQETTNERAQLRDANGAPLADNRVLLDDVIRIQP